MKEFRDIIYKAKQYVESNIQCSCGNFSFYVKDRIFRVELTCKNCGKHYMVGKWIKNLKG